MIFSLRKINWSTKDNEEKVKLLYETFMICLGCLHTVFQESLFQRCKKW